MAYLFVPGRQPLVPVVLCFMIGICIGDGLPCNKAVFQILVAIVYFSALLWFIAFWVRDSFPYFSLIWLPGGLGLFVAFGYLNFVSQLPSIQPHHFSQHNFSYYRVQFLEEPKLQGTHFRVLAKVLQGQSGADWINTEGKLLLRIPRAVQERLTLDVGHQYILQARIQAIPPPSNPGAFHYAQYMQYKGIYDQAYISEEAIIELSPSQKHDLWTLSQIWQKRLVQKFLTHLHDPIAQSIASTLILGFRADLKDEVLEIFSVTGTIHILSVSGMHVVLVFWLLSKLLIIFDFLPYAKAFKAFFLIFGVWFYAFLTGCSPSVLRAAGMITLVIIALRLQKPSSIYNGIGGSALVLLAYQPGLLFDIGFQLSYLAVLSIVFVMPWLQKIWRSPFPFLKPVWSYMHLSFAAQLGSFPLAMYYFQQFPLYFLPANLWMAIPSSFIMYVGIALLINPIEAWNSYLGMALEKLILVSMQVLEWWSQLPGASYQTDAWPWYMITMLYGFLICALLASMLLQRSYLWGGIAFAILLMGIGEYQNFQKMKHIKGVIYAIKGQVAITLMGNDKQWVWTDFKNNKDPSFTFHVWPNIKGGYKEGHSRWLQGDTLFQEDHWIVAKGYFQLGEWSMLVLDEPISPTEVPKVNLLYIRQNSLRDLGLLQDHQKPDYIVVDASSTKNLVEKWREQAYQRGWAFHATQDKFAYVWQVKQER
jgi:competence protein ComEC